ncbi:MAG TPA: sensor histidine kinase [Pyrinomonadaceae bacterium]|nr:sensor histidine kinase [Pyrinomonadaceae bacterium]
MRLAEFIRRNMENILAEWESFAATLLPAASSMTSLALRDHAKEILEAVATDLGTSQTSEEQAEKSKGRAPKILNAPQTAAETHAVLRARSGFDINQLAAEYRALRASVLRLWMAAPENDGDIEDIIRFNEAIDQAIVESISFFSTQVNQARDLFLGMLGHDMRSPLNTVLLTARHLAALNAGEQVSAAAARLIRSGASMKALLDDLLDFNRTQLGVGINIGPAQHDLAVLFADELEQLQGAHPDRRIELEVTEPSRGFWDGARLQQLLRNLVTNALKYGAKDTPVRVVVIGAGPEVTIEVRNNGEAIAASALKQIFDPLKRGISNDQDESGLGLGLYIVSEIARAHGGEVTARSREGETVFAVRLPRGTESGSGDHDRTIEARA